MIRWVAKVEFDFFGRDGHKIISTAQLPFDAGDVPGDVPAADQGNEVKEDAARPRGG